MKKIFLILILFLAASTTVFADVYVKTNMHLDAMNDSKMNDPKGDFINKVLSTVGTLPVAYTDAYSNISTYMDSMNKTMVRMPARDIVNEQWISFTKTADINPDRTIIIDLEKNKIYIIIHKNKVYSEAAFPPKPDDLFPAGRKMGMMPKPKIAVTVTPTGKKKKLNSRSCEEYDVKINTGMMTVNEKIYATTDVPAVLLNNENFKISMRPQMTMSDNTALKEFSKIKGYHIMTERTVKMMGAPMKSKMEVLEITEKPAPKDIYSVPSGYKKQDKLPMPEFPGIGHDHGPRK